MSCPCYVIHRPKDTERDFLVKNLQREIPTLEIFAGLEGSLFLDMPHLHPETMKPVAPPVLGCGMSHLTILRNSLKAGYDQVCIFEDDAVIKKDIGHLLNKPLQDCDVYYLGLSDMIRGIPHFTNSSEFPIWKSSWDHFQILQSSGAFGYIVSRKAMEAILSSFYKAMKEGFFYPFDMLVSRAIKEHSLTALVPREHLVDYQRGLWSYLSNRIR